MITRREMLSWLAAHAATVPLMTTVGCGPPPPPEWERLALRAAQWFAPDDLGPVRSLGGAFLDAIGRERARLEVELEPTLALLEASAPADQPAVYEAAIAADFRAARVYDVAGWTLAATETHLSALVELFGIDAGDLRTEAP